MVFAIPTDTCYWFACGIYDKTSYDRILSLKWRNISKPFSIVVKSFEDICDLIEINEKQINDLKEYKYPFTIIWAKKQDFKLPDYLDKSVYKSIWVRVAEFCLSKDVFEIMSFPAFLTSANISNEWEIYNFNELNEKFWNYEDVEFFDWVCWKQKPSDVFKYICDSTEKEYFRKNHVL